MAESLGGLSEEAKISLDDIGVNLDSDPNQFKFSAGEDAGLDFKSL